MGLGDILRPLRQAPKAWNSELRIERKTLHACRSRLENFSLPAMMDKIVEVTKSGAVTVGPSERSVA